jgi:hypothetical protein
MRPSFCEKAPDLQAVELEAPVHASWSNEFGMMSKGHPCGQATVLWGEIRNSCKIPFPPLGLNTDPEHHGSNIPQSVFITLHGATCLCFPNNYTHKGQCSTPSCSPLISSTSAPATRQVLHFSLVGWINKSMSVPLLTWAFWATAIQFRWKMVFYWYV